MQRCFFVVTLEPCCHFGKTPPCTEQIIASGIKRVIFSVKDPNPLVGGKGAQRLTQNGIEVSEGLLQEQATELNEDFFWSITNKQAWVSLKLAMTLDGKIADTAGSSKWITGESAREYVHELRRCHAAVAVGKGTLQADDPQLTVRHKKGYSPARIIFSSDNQISQNSYFFLHSAETRSIVVVSGGDSSEIKKNRDRILVYRTNRQNPESAKIRSNGLPAKSHKHLSGRWPADRIGVSTGWSGKPALSFMAVKYWAMVRMESASQRAFHG